MKRLLCGLSIILLVLVMISPAAYAATLEGTYAQVAAANQQIEQCIADAKAKADQLYATRFEKTGQERAAVNHEIDAIIAQLISDTNAISANVIRQAADVGVKVICTYVKVEVGGKKVKIDPLVICNE